jgi:F-type H+-transporting ATPase subunit epsilon
VAQTFPCSIVTPAETVFEGDVVYASLPAWDGQQGIMHGQSPILMQLGFGSLRLDMPGGESRWYLLEGGFAQVAGGSLCLITRRATPPEELDEEEAVAEFAAAGARAVAPGVDRDRVEQEQQRAYAKRAMVRSRGARGAPPR